MSKIMINCDLICGARASQLFIADTTPGHQWYLSCELYKFGQSPKSGGGSKGSNYSTFIRAPTYVLGQKRLYLLVFVRRTGGSC